MNITATWAVIQLLSVVILFFIANSYKKDGQYKWMMFSIFLAGVNFSTLIHTLFK